MKEVYTKKSLFSTRYLILDQKPQEIAPLLKEFKHPYMIWNEVFVNLHLETLDRLHKKLEPFFC